jgi:hypothetical protein
MKAAGINKPIIPVTSIFHRFSAQHAEPGNNKITSSNNFRYLNSGSRAFCLILLIGLQSSALDIETVIISKKACGSLVVSGAMLQAGRSRLPFPMRSLNFSIDLILTAALWLWGHHSL